MWTINDKEILNCNNVDSGDNSAVIDIRKTNKEACFDIMRAVIPNLYSFPDLKHVCTSSIDSINAMYKAHWNGLVKTHGLTKYYDGIGRKLRLNQLEALVQGHNKKYNLFALEQGLGKTLLSATLARMNKHSRTIIVCPSLVKWNWFYDLTDEWGFEAMFFTILDRHKSRSIKAWSIERFVIVNYEMVEKKWDELTVGGCSHIVLDEVHYVKNHTSGRHKSVAKLIKYFSGAQVTMLSGTPMTNRVVDLFAYMKLAKHPLGSNYFRFKKEYTKGTSKIVGAKNIGDLQVKMSNFMIRQRTEEYVDLPPLFIKKYYFHLEDFQDEYDKVMGEMVERNDRVMVINEELKALSKIADKDDAYVNQLKKEKRELSISMQSNIMTMNRLTSTAKVPGIIEAVENLNSQGHKVVVFCGFNDPLNLLKEHFGDAAVKIDGSVDALSRENFIKSFKNDDKVTVFLGQNIAAGIGINLVNATHVIFMNFPFTPDWIEQPYKRLHRPGQKNAVHVHFTICKETIDEHIYKLIKNKLNDINEIIDKNGKGTIVYDNLQSKLFKSLLKTSNESQVK
jgi:SNF2 family DNA or RNA helicase